MANSVPRSCAVLLAAGAGVRYGMPKVCAEGGLWLRKSVSAVHEGGCDDVIVVLGAAIVDVPEPARAVVAPDWATGISASLRAGLRAADGADFAVVHTVDTPDVGPDVVQRVLAAAQSAPSGLARAYYGPRPGHPVVVAARHWPQLIAELDGDQGAREFLRGRSDLVAVDCADLATGLDIDRPGPVNPGR